MAKAKNRKSDYPKLIDGKEVYAQYPAVLTGPVLAELNAKGVTLDGKPVPGNWTCASVLQEGELRFISDSPVFTSMEACSRMCMDFNTAHGWSWPFVRNIIHKAVVNAQKIRDAQKS